MGAGDSQLSGGQRGRSADLLGLLVEGNSHKLGLILSKLKPRAVRRLALRPVAGAVTRGRKSSNTAVHVCAKLGHFSCLVTLLQYCRHDQDVKEARNGNGDTPLMLAALEGHLTCMQYLLSSGCNVAARNTWEETALHKAAQCSQPSRTDCMQLLLQHGASPKAKCAMGWTALHWAVREHHPECVALLINAGCPLNAIDQIRVTALSEAASEGCVESVQLLLAADACVEVRDLSGNLAVHEAARNDNAECVDLLLKAGTSINERGSYWNTSLHISVRENHMDCVQVLLDHGADPYLNNGDGNNCFALAAACSSLRMHYMLVECTNHIDKPRWYGAKSRRLERTDSDGRRVEKRTALPLQKLARFAIRSQLGGRCSMAIEKLPLPQPMKDFLLYMDVPPDDVIQLHQGSETDWLRLSLPLSPARMLPPLQSPA